MQDSEEERHCLFEVFEKVYLPEETQEGLQDGEAWKEVDQKVQICDTNLQVLEVQGAEATPWQQKDLEVCPSCQAQVASHTPKALLQLSSNSQYYASSSTQIAKIDPKTS